ncbi:MAG: PilN domain-containing protein [Opitutales bacterium]
MPPALKLFSRDPDPNRDRIRLLPADAFFVESVNLPADETGTPVEETAALLLEAEAPFPLDQLAWGCRFCTHSRTLLVYAAFSDRLAEHLENSPLEAYRQVFPEFLTACKPEPTVTDTYGILLSDTSLAALRIPAGGTVPDRLAARKRPDDAETRKSTEAALLREIGCPDPAESETLTRPRAREPHPEQIRLTVDTALEESRHHSLSGDALWRADIRPPDFKRAERRGRRLDLRLWRTVTGLTATLLVLLLGEGLLLGLNLWAEARDERVTDRAPAVSRLESQLDFVTQLEQRATGAMQPFTVLAIMNEGRPETLYFTDAEATDFRQFSVEAVARSPGEVNAYVDRLRALPWFEQVDLKINSVSGRTLFTLNLVVASLPDLGPETPES